MSTIDANQNRLVAPRRSPPPMVGIAVALVMGLPLWAALAWVAYSLLP